MLEKGLFCGYYSFLAADAFALFFCLLVAGYGYTYTHLGLEDATDGLKRMEELENARKELEKNKEEKPVSQKMFRAI